MSTTWPTFAGAFEHTLLIVLVRALPFAVYSAAWARGRMPARLGVVAGYVLLLLGLDAPSAAALCWVAGGSLYYAIVMMGTRVLAPQRVTGLDALLVFGVLFALLIALPMLALPAGVATLFVFIGWELLLKGYSFAAEGGAASLPLRESLFFFLVDPTLVVSHRAVREAEPPPTGVWARRCAGGCVALSLASLAAPWESGAVWASAALQLGPAACWVPKGATHFMLDYARHAGVASLQIGLMGALGFSLGERYDRPHLARSPADFWGRWNVYVAHWLRRYVHFPVSKALARSRLGLTGELNAAVSALWVFWVMGAMHDALTGLSLKELSWAWTGFFVCNGMFLLLWRALDRRLTRAPSGWPVLARAGFFISFFAIVGIWT